MIEINETRDIKADIESIWKVLTDESRETYFWSSLRNIEVEERSDTKIIREATVGPRLFGMKTRQVISLDYGKFIGLEITGDRIDGSRKITLTQEGGSVSVNVVWSLNLKDVPDFVIGIVQTQITKVTREALDKITQSTKSE